MEPCCGILPRGPSHDEGCLDGESTLKTHRPRRWGRWAEILLFGKSPGSWLGVGSVVVESSFRGGVRCAGKGSPCYSRRVFGYVGALHGDLPGARVASNLDILYGDPFFPSSTIIMAASPRTITTRMESFRPPPPRASTEPVPHAL
jgi:hypothetical protein